MLTKMKKDPNSPHTNPITTAAGISSKDDSPGSSEPNFTAAESLNEKVFPEDSEKYMPRRKVVMEQEAKTRQSMLNVQKVFGFDIS